MKAITLFAALMMLSCILRAEIRNGYGPQLHNTIVTLNWLSSRLSSEKSLPFFDRQLIKAEIKRLTDIISHYEATQQLINQFRVISPSIYNELDSIRDKRKRPVDIFIKLMPREGAKVALDGATFFIQSKIDDDATVSEYGENSIVVSLWIGSNSLLLLSHELGHAKHVIPNLAEYLKFYRKCYNRRLSDISYVGHNQLDKSGKMAMHFEYRFRTDLAAYLFNGGRKFESTASLFERLKRNSRKPEMPKHPELSFAWAFARR
jgi:hypothetical protein